MRRKELIEDLRWARLADTIPPFAQHRPRRRGRRAQGIRYEASVHSHFTHLFGDSYIASPWFQFIEGAAKAYGGANPTLFSSTFLQEGLPSWKLSTSTQLMRGTSSTVTSRSSGRCLESRFHMRFVRWSNGTTAQCSFPSRCAYSPVLTSRGKACSRFTSLNPAPRYAAKLPDSQTL